MVKVNYDESNTAPVIRIRNDEMIANSIGRSTWFQERKQGHPPSRILGRSKIYVPEDLDDWSNYDFRQKHPCFLRPNLVPASNFNKVFQISMLEDLLDSLPEDSPILKPEDPRDWPFCFMAQLSLASEFQGITPKELLRIFCIKYEGPSKNTWDSFKWRDDIEPKYIAITLRGGRDYERLQ